MSLTRICPCGCNQRIPLNARHCATANTADRQRRNRRVSTHRYHSTNWQTVRAQRHTIAHGQCELNLPGCTGTATHTHLDERLDGRHDIATIHDCKACCPSCSGAIDAPRAKSSPTRGGGSATQPRAATSTRARHSREKLGGGSLDGRRAVA